MPHEREIRTLRKHELIFEIINESLGSGLEIQRLPVAEILAGLSEGTHLLDENNPDHVKDGFDRLRLQVWLDLGDIIDFESGILPFSTEEQRVDHLQQAKNLRSELPEKFVKLGVLSSHLNNHLVD